MKFTTMTAAEKELNYNNNKTPSSQCSHLLCQRQTSYWIFVLGLDPSSKNTTNPQLTVVSSGTLPSTGKLEAYDISDFYIPGGNPLDSPRIYRRMTWIFPVWSLLDPIAPSIQILVEKAQQQAPCLNDQLSVLISCPLRAIKATYPTVPIITEYLWWQWVALCRLPVLRNIFIHPLSLLLWHGDIHFFELYAIGF